MKYINTLFLFFLGLFFSSATLQAQQNLIPNPSFETFASCPSDTAEFVGNISKWYAPFGSPDLFNACGTVAGVPLNTLGNQVAFTGDSYAGFYAFEANNYREYIAVNFSEKPMEAGKTYCVEFKLSLAEAFAGGGIQNIGIRFSVDSLSGNLLGTQPQLLHQQTILSDSQNWMEFAGIFQPNQDYGYLAIGNFFNNQNTIGNKVVPGTNDLLPAYYFIDEISVIEITSPVATVSPTNFCENDVIFISDDQTIDNFSQYQWYEINNPNTIISTSSFFQTTAQPATYVVTKTVQNCVLSDTISIALNSSPEVFFTTENVCANNLIQFTDASTNVNPNATYEWDIFNDGTVDFTTKGGIEYVFDPPVIASVKLTVSNGACSSEFITTVDATQNCDPCQDINNLVPNGDAEIFNDCPTGLNVQDNDNEFDFISQWQQASKGTPDFFNACSTPSNNANSADIPTNTFGSQTPVSGNSYMGLYALRADDKREYITTQLLEALLPNRQYCIDISVSLAETSSDAIEHLGIHLSENDISDYSIETVLPITPALESAGGFLTNTQTWSVIAGSFLPSDTINYITIGNFRNNANTNTTPNTHPQATVGANLAYYYIDNISVVELPPILPFTELEACVGEPITIVGANEYCSYNWQLTNGLNLGNTSSIETTFDAPGVYEVFVTANLGNCSRVEVIDIIVNEVPSASFQYSTACVGEATVLLNSSTGYNDNTLFDWYIDGIFYTSTNLLGSLPVDFVSTGTYEISLTAIDTETNCEDTFTQTIVIDQICDQCDGGDIVLNGSFEFISQCPTAINQINNTLNWGSQNTNIPIGYFNVCATEEDAGVPANSLGSQEPYDGFGYAGLVAFANSNSRSHLYSVLETPMIAGNEYCVEMYVSCADNSEFAVSNLGVYFSQNNPIGTNALNFNPQITGPNSPIVSADGWVKISGNFTASANFNYMVIGNFKNNAQTTTTNNGGSLPLSYYYIDAVAVTPFTVELPANQSICLGETITLTAETDLCEYEWINQLTGQVIGTNLSLTVQPTQTSNYVFRAKNENCGTIDRTVTITVLGAPDLGPDITICENGTAQLSVQNNGNSVTWSPATGLNNPNSPTPIASPSTTTTYTVTINNNNNNCPNTASITVFVEQVNATITTTNNSICAGETVTANVQGGDTFEWTPSTGVSNPTAGNNVILSPTTTTTYSVKVSDAQTGCFDVVEITINVLPCDEGGPQWTINGLPVNQIYDTTDVNTNLTVNFPIIIDPDLPSDAFTISATEPNNGTFDFNNIQGTYLPDFGFVGNDTVVITVCDILTPIECDDVELIITVFSENLPPQFVGVINQNQFVNMTVDSIWNFCFNIIDPEEEAIVLSIQDFPNNGFAVNLPNTYCIQYNPQGYIGTEQMAIIACDADNLCTTVNIFFEITGTPLPPMVADTLFSAYENTSTNFCLALFDANNDIETIEIIDDLENGQIIIDDDGCMLFTPSVNFSGNDTLVVLVCDATNLCSQAEIIIVTSETIGAYFDAYNIEEGLPTYFYPTDNDVPELVDTMYIVTPPFIGTVEIVDTTNFASIIYYPPSNISALDSLSYAICSVPFGCDTAWIYVNVQNLLFVQNDSTITSINTNTTIDITTNDGTPDVSNNSFTLTLLSEPQNGTLQDNGDGTFTYIPNDNFVGTDTFTYQVCAQNTYGCSNIATVSIQVLNAQVPEPSIDFANTDANTEVSIFVLDNDTDPQNSPIAIVPNSLIASNGTATINNDGSIVYTPNIGFSGTDTLFYNIANLFGLQAQSYVVIEVSGCTLKVQQALTPNNDGLNDEWVINNLINCTEFAQNTVIVYNRWGNIVFEAENYGTNGWWNGDWQKKDEPLPVGTYFYVIALKGQKSKDFERGAIEIIR